MKLSVLYLVAAFLIGSTSAFVLPQGSLLGRTNECGVIIGQAQAKNNDDDEMPLVTKLEHRGETKNFVHRVVLTGGPCGGKSSILNDVTKTLAEKGWDVLCVPEVPTIMLNGGCKYPSDPKDLVIFEKALIQAQLQLERSFIEIAASADRPTIVVMDRGLLDVAAYLPADLWQETLKAVDLTEEKIAERYDLVLHLTTAADGAEEFYTTANNEARTETPEQARELDRKILSCYDCCHKNVQVVDNSSDFAGKLKRATDHVLTLLEGTAT